MKAMTAYKVSGNARFCRVTSERLRQAGTLKKMQTALNNYPAFMQWAPIITPYAMEKICGDKALLDKFEEGIKTSSLLTDRSLGKYIYDALTEKGLELMRVGDGHIPMLGLSGTTSREQTLLKDMIREFDENPTLNRVTLQLLSHGIELEIATKALTEKELMGLKKLDLASLSQRVSTIVVTGGTIDPSVQYSGDRLEVDRRSLADPVQSMMMLGPLGG